MGSQPISPEERAPESVRTTIRLSKTVHDQLKRVSGEAERTAELIIQDALQDVLPRISFGLIEQPDVWSPLLAARFIQFLPSPFVIKDIHANVIYANPAYEDEFKIPLVELRGKALPDFGLRSWEREKIMADFKAVVKNDRLPSFKHSVETVSFPDGRTIPYRAICFRFDANEKLVGDFSFSWTKFFDKQQQRHQEEELSTSMLCKKVLECPLSPGLETLFTPALENCPLSIVVKSATDLSIVWCNGVFQTLAEQADTTIKNRKDVVGKTSQAIWKLSDYDPIVQNDLTVQQRDKAMYFDEQLPSLKGVAQGLRTSLRFPIPGRDRKPKFIGVISPHLLHDALTKN